MEKLYTAKTFDGKTIYGKLNYIKPGKTLIIFVHGLTGSINEHIFFNAAKFFPERNFHTLRFNLYSSEKNARRLEECTINLHSEDLDQVIESVRKDFEKNIFSWSQSWRPNYYAI